MYYLNSNIDVIKDNWTIKEIDCFSKPHAILLESLAEGTYRTYNYFVGLYKSYGVCHGLYENQDWSFGIYEYVAKALGFFYHRHYCEERSELREQIRICFEQKKAVIVPVDLYYLFYSWAYKKVHAFHLFLVIGWDEERDVYVVIDNLQNIDKPVPEYENVSGKFTYFQITGEMLFSGWEGLDNLPFTYYSNRFITITTFEDKVKRYNEIELLHHFINVFQQGYVPERFREIYCMKNIIAYFKDKTKCIEKELPHFRLGVIFGNKEGILKQVYNLALRVEQASEFTQLKENIEHIIKNWRDMERIFCFHLLRGDLQNISQLEESCCKIFEKEKNFSEKIAEKLKL